MINVSHWPAMAYSAIPASNVGAVFLTKSIFSLVSQDAIQNDAKYVDGMFE